MRSVIFSLLALSSLIGSVVVEAQVSGPASGLPAYYQASSSSVTCATGGTCTSVTLTPVIHGDYVVWWQDATTDDLSYTVTSSCDGSLSAINTPCTVDISLPGGAEGTSTPLYVEYAICPAAGFSYQNGYPSCQLGDVTWNIVAWPSAPYVSTVYAPGYVAPPASGPENPHWVGSGFSACQGSGTWSYDAWSPASGCGAVIQTHNALSCTGTGTQSQTVTCQDATATVIADSYCTDAKPATSQSCALSAATCTNPPVISQPATLTDACPAAGSGSSGAGDGSAAGNASGGSGSGAGSGTSDGSGVPGPGVNLPNCVPSPTTFCIVVPASSR